MEKSNKNKNYYLFSSLLGVAGLIATVYYFTRVLESGDNFKIFIRGFWVLAFIVFVISQIRGYISEKVKE